jgi:hypothetical protein
MIVQPDFADHWKTDLLVRMAGSESAVRCLLRFWSHCQNRRKWRFDELCPSMLAGICKWTGDENVFWDAMTHTFLDVEDGIVIAHEWETINSRLIHNWTVGPKGGRPPKPQDDEKNPRDTQGVTHRGIEGLEGLDREEKTECVSSGAVDSTPDHANPQVWHTLRSQAGISKPK